MEQIGPYQVVGELGRGAAGVVYRVRDPRVADRELAIKVITLPPEQESSTLERFLREAEALARVQHGGVVRVHGLERHPRGAYLIQELVEGEVLQDRIKRGALAANEAARIVRGLADALTAVHRVGILHRDLKPGNVILRDGEPVLLDFGVARDLDAESLTKSGAMLGTPAYMSPEQAAGEAVGPTADVYSLGVILYELLTGLRPFRGHLLAVLKQVFDDTPTWPNALGVDVPAELEAVLRVAMAKEPSDRYESAEALREDLDRFLAGRPTQAAARVKTDAGSRRVLGAAALGLVVVLVAAVAWLQPWQQSALAAETPTPEATRSQPEVEAASEPAEPRLWELRRGDTFQAQLTFDERGAAQVRMDATVDVVVEWVEGETAHLTLTVTTITARFGVLVGELDEPANADEPLSSLLQEAMAPFLGTLDLRTGATTLTDLELIQRRIRAQPEAIKVLELPLEAFAGKHSRVDLAGTLCKIFSSEYLGTSMDCLTRVVGAGWREHDPPGTFELAAREPSPRLRFVQLDRNSQGAVRLEGSATYERGRLESAVMHQSLVTRPDCSTRWSWTLLE